MDKIDKLRDIINLIDVINTEKYQRDKRLKALQDLVDTSVNLIRESIRTPENIDQNVLMVYLQNLLVWSIPNKELKDKALEAFVIGADIVREDYLRGYTRFFGE